MRKKLKFPKAGLKKEELLPLLTELKTKDAAWRDGKTFSLVFFPGEEVAQVVEEAYNSFFFENALNPTAFPSLRKFETEVVAMAADLMNGDAEIAGNMTSGGTESILLSVKAARDKALRENPEMREPEMIVPLSVHPAFMKAAHYFNVKPVVTPLRPDFRADVDAIEKAITPNTILIVGSAPAYPHGLVDPITEITAVAHKNGILCHVDACVGGFMLPFARDLGYNIPPFDFSVEGVTSMSMDLHKYGYSAKGASIILYRNREIRKNQYFVYTDWPGGIYASPTISGTRGGGSIAASWAVLKLLGRDGYMKIAGEVMHTTKRLIDGINAINGLQVISNPDISVFAFASDRYDIFSIGDEMTLKGWHIDRQQFPDSLHLTVSQTHKDIVDDFLADLEVAVRKTVAPNWNNISARVAVNMVKGAEAVLPERTFSKITKMMQKKGKGKYPVRTAALYGLAGSLSNRGDVYEMVMKLLDTLNQVD